MPFSFLESLPHTLTQMNIRLLSVPYCDRCWENCDRRDSFIDALGRLRWRYQAPRVSKKKAENATFKGMKNPKPLIYKALNRTEREGFEPSKDVNTLNRLAICRFRPLSHLSKMTVTNYSTHILFLPTPNFKIPQSLTLSSIRDLNRPPLPQSP